MKNTFFYLIKNKFYTFLSIYTLKINKTLYLFKILLNFFNFYVYTNKNIKK